MLLSFMGTVRDNTQLLEAFSQTELYEVTALLHSLITRTRLTFGRISI